MSIATSQEPRLSKPGPLIADPSNTAALATSSHRAAAATAEAERKIRAEIAAQRAAEGSPVITPPPETPISTTNSNKQSLTLVEELEDEDKSVDNIRDNLARKPTKTKDKINKRAHVPVNGQGDNGAERDELRLIQAICVKVCHGCVILSLFF